MANVVVISNITSLRAYTGGASSPSIWVEGYTNPADGGEGNFIFVPTDTTSPDNSGTIIVDATGNRYYRENHQGPYNILWFGARNDGSTDTSSSLNRALSALSSNAGEIIFPPGTFLFQSLVTYNMPAGAFSLSLAGAGADATILYWPSTSGIVINQTNSLHSVHMRDMSITTGTANQSLTGVFVSNTTYLVQAQSDFFRVTFRANVPSTKNGWATCLYIFGLCNVSYDTLLFLGPGVGNGLIVSSNTSHSSDYSIIHNVAKSEFLGLENGFVYQTYVQGVTIAQCNFSNCINGVLVPAGATGLSQLAIVGSQFGGNTSNNIAINGLLGQLILSGNVIFIFANVTGVIINAGGQANQATFLGNTFIGIPATGNTGIEVLGSASGSIVTGNSFFNLAVGINLSGATSWNVQANVYPSVGSKVTNIGSNSVGVATD